jgi:hypothetical protein
LPPPSIKLTIILSFIAIFLTIWACKKDTIDVKSNLSDVTPTKNPKASDRTLTDPNCCEFTNLFCPSNLKPSCNPVYTDNGGNDIFVLNGLVVKGTTYQLTPLFYDSYSPDYGLTTGTGTTILTDIAKDVLVENEINASQPVEKEFAILYDIADLLQQGASIEAIQARIGNKGTIETLSNGQKQLIVNSTAFESRDVSNLSIVPSFVDCVLKKERVAQRFSDLTGIRLAICQNIIKNDPSFDCNGCNNPMRLFNHFLTMLDIKGGKNWEIAKLSDQERNDFRAGIYKAFLINGVKMSSSDASAFAASNSTFMKDLLKPSTTPTTWCVAYENGKRTVKIKVLKQKLGISEADATELYDLHQKLLIEDQDYRSAYTKAGSPELGGGDWIDFIIDRIKLSYKSLNPAEKAFLKAHPQLVLHIKINSDLAVHNAIRFFGESGQWDCSDAFRHCLFQALNIQSIGYAFTKEFADAHEFGQDPNDPTVQMDFHNNWIGFQIGLANPLATLEDIINIVKQKMKNGELKIYDETTKTLISSSGCF